MTGRNDWDFESDFNEVFADPKPLGPLRPYCNKCGWRKGGPDSWDGVKCKCGLTEPPADVIR